MFDNIGGKIKTLAKVQCWIGIIASVIMGIAMMAEMPDTAIVGLLIMILGSLLSWISCFVLYGFGEMVDKTCNIEAMIGTSKFQSQQNQTNVVPNPNLNPNPSSIPSPNRDVEVALANLMKERESETISAEEYRQRRAEILQNYSAIGR